MKWLREPKTFDYYVCLTLNAQFEVKRFVDTKSFNKYVAVLGPFYDSDLQNLYKEEEIKELVRASWRKFRNKILCVKLAKHLLQTSLREAKDFAYSAIKGVKVKGIEVWQSEEEKQMDRLKNIAFYASMYMNSKNKKYIKGYREKLKMFLDYNVAYNLLAEMQSEEDLKSFLKETQK